MLTVECMWFLVPFYIYFFIYFVFFIFRCFNIIEYLCDAIVHCSFVSELLFLDFLLLIFHFYLCQFGCCVAVFFFFIISCYSYSTRYTLFILIFLFFFIFVILPLTVCKYHCEQIVDSKWSSVKYTIVEEEWRVYLNEIHSNWFLEVIKGRNLVFFPF